MALPKILQTIAGLLPKSGGTVTGNVTFSNASIFGNKTDIALNNNEGVWISSKDGETRGAEITLRTQAYASNSGGFELVAQSGDNSRGLTGRANGYLDWQGELFATALSHRANGSQLKLRSDNRNVELASEIAIVSPTWGEEGNRGLISLRAVKSGAQSNLELLPNGSATWAGKSLETVDSKGDDYIRYKNGLQICWGRTQSGNTATFPVAFSSVPGITTIGESSSDSGRCVNVKARTTTYVEVVHISWTFYYIAVGYWN